MNRRRFCFEISASLACLGAPRAMAECALAPSSVISHDASDPYPIWSLLVPILQCQCPPTRGYMIAQRSAVPDALPYAGSFASGTPIERARNAMGHPYETDVPPGWQARFAQAIANANQRKTDIVALERRFTFPNRYRLLSQDQIKDYLALTPHVASAGWRPDAKTARYYHGWGDYTSLSLPYFDTEHELALIWARTSGGGCSSAGWYFFNRFENRWTQAKWESMRRAECA